MMIEKIINYFLRFILLWVFLHLSNLCSPDELPTNLTGTCMYVINEFPDK